MKQTEKIMKKEGQITITFNWIYVLIAGAVILLFFVGIVVKQKAVSEERLATDVVQILDSIFTSAAVADKTKIYIDTQGLADYNLFFDCLDGVSEFGVKGLGLSEQDSTTPVFVPREVQAQGLILWSLPYNFPFKVIDFLFIIPNNQKFFLLGSDPVFSEEFLNATADENERLRIEVSSVDDLSEIKGGLNLDLRIIDLNGVYLHDGEIIPDPLLESKKLTAVSFNALGVRYFEEREGRWSLTDKETYPVISLAQERDAAKYAAIFSGDGKNYWCNMQKAMRRLSYVSEVYNQKAQEIYDHYEGRGGSCLVLLSGGDNALSNLLFLQGNAVSCSLVPEGCEGLVVSGKKLQDDNHDLREENCLQIY